MTLMMRFARGSLAMAALCLATGCGPLSSADLSSMNAQDDAGLEIQTPVTKDILDRQTEIAALRFADPPVTDSLRASILASYPNLDPQHLVPRNLLSEALVFFDANKGKIKNQNVLSIVDFAAYSGEKRFYIVDMKTGSVFRGSVAHGSGSDPAHSGYAKTFSNQSGSNASSIGFYLASEIYTGSHGRSVRLDGLSSTNSNARARAVVLHGAAYVNENGAKQGRSWGCLAVPMDERDLFVDRLSGGSLIYAGLGGKSLEAPATPPDPPSTGTPSADPSPTVLQVPPLWEAARGEVSRAWTTLAANLIKSEGSNLIKGTSDMPSFCPTYNRLDENGKINVWVYLISAVVKYESAFNPVSRMRENLGTDSVTHLPVYSEGLLQLSYQDARGYTFCNEFDWGRDRSLAGNDPRKTILDPIKNLRCGIRILNRIVGKHNAIAFNSGHYWSTLMPKHSAVHSIRSIVNSMALCRR